MKIAMKKCYILLNLYTSLLRNGEISIETCCNEYGISVPTFRRYLADLRSYFLEKEGKEIVYDAVNKVYKLDGK